MLGAWPDVTDIDLSSFWAKGQTRSAEYEDALRGLLPRYNAGADGFLDYRPDYVVTPFKPCAVTAAISDDIEAINVAIRRDAHAFEFTAQRNPTTESIRTYLRAKLNNYVEVTQEQ